jgi:hypothetical protein
MDNRTLRSKVPTLFSSERLLPRDLCKRQLLKAKKFKLYYRRARSALPAYLSGEDNQ